MIKVQVLIQMQALCNGGRPICPWEKPKTATVTHTPAISPARCVKAVAISPHGSAWKISLNSCFRRSAHMNTHQSRAVCISPLAMYWMTSKRFAMTVVHPLINTNRYIQFNLEWLEEPLTFHQQHSKSSLMIPVLGYFSPPP